MIWINTSSVVTSMVENQAIYVSANQYSPNSAVSLQALTGDPVLAVASVVARCGPFPAVT